MEATGRAAAEDAPPPTKTQGILHRPGERMRTAKPANRCGFTWKCTILTAARASRTIGRSSTLRGMKSVGAGGRGSGLAAGIGSTARVAVAHGQALLKA